MCLPEATGFCLPTSLPPSLSLSLSPSLPHASCASQHRRPMPQRERPTRSLTVCRAPRRCPTHRGCLSRGAATCPTVTHPCDAALGLLRGAGSFGAHGTLSPPTLRRELGGAQMRTRLPGAGACPCFERVSESKGKPRHRSQHKPDAEASHMKDERARVFVGDRGTNR